MPIFRYEAEDPQGKVMSGAMDAPDALAVEARLQGRGYRHIAILPPGAQARPAVPVAAQSGSAAAAPSRPQPTAAPPPAGGLPSPSHADTALFFRQFAQLLKSGISPYQSLENLAPRTRQKGLSVAAMEMLEVVRGGGRMSEAMARRPEVFAPHAVGAVAAGELGGFVEIAMDELATESEHAVAMRKGLWLPIAFVKQAIVGIFIAQPVFPHIFPRNDLRAYFLLLCLRNLPILAALWLGWAFAQKRMMRWDQRAWRDKMVLKLGPAGDLERQRSLLAFLRMLRRLSAAGMMPDTAWEGAMNVAPNAEVRQRLNEAYLLIRGGMPLHEAFAQTGLFADQTEQMLATGVVSGQVVDALDSICAYYQQRVEQSVGATRYLMFRIGSVLTIVLTGVLLILMMKLYFTSVFEFADTFSAGN